MREQDTRRAFTEEIQEHIMDIIVDVYEHMDDEERAHWSPEAARAVVRDQIEWDRARDIIPLPYDPDDFYDTIRALIEQGD